MSRDFKCMALGGVNPYWVDKEGHRCNFLEFFKKTEMC